MLTRMRFDFRYFTMISTTTSYEVPWKVQRQCDICHSIFISEGNNKYCHACIIRFHIRRNTTIDDRIEMVEAQ